MSAGTWDVLNTSRQGCSDCTYSKLLPFCGHSTDDVRRGTAHRVMPELGTRCAE